MNTCLASELKRNQKFALEPGTDRRMKRLGEIRAHSDNELLAIEFKDTGLGFDFIEAIGADVEVYIG